MSVLCNNQIAFVECRKKYYKKSDLIVKYYKINKYYVKININQTVEYYALTLGGGFLDMDYVKSGLLLN